MIQLLIVRTGKWIYDNSTSPSRRIPTYRQKVWLKSEWLYNDLDLLQNIAERIGVQGTPACVLNNQLIPGLQPRAYFQQQAGAPL